MTPPYSSNVSLNTWRRVPVLLADRRRNAVVLRLVRGLAGRLPQVFGDQTDVPESGDWWDAGYLIMWGSNVPVTRTPDAHWMTEARYRGQKVIAVSPDYADNVKFADEWLAPAPGTDGALAMAMGHLPFLVTFEKQGDHSSRPSSSPRPTSARPRSTPSSRPSCSTTRPVNQWCRTAPSASATAPRVRGSGTSTSVTPSHG